MEFVCKVKLGAQELDERTAIQQLHDFTSREWRRAVFAAYSPGLSVPARTLVVELRSYGKLITSVIEGPEHGGCDIEDLARYLADFRPASDVDETHWRHGLNLLQKALRPRGVRFRGRNSQIIQRVEALRRGTV